MKWMTAVVAKYLDRNATLKIGDMGSCKPRRQTDTYRPIFTACPNWTYVGIDICHGHNVDIVVDTEYKWDIIKNDEFDVVISGQVMEHVDAPWLFANALARICKPGGWCMVTAPSRWKEHRTPLDCWRIQADGMRSVMTKYAPFIEVECRTENFDDMHGDTYFVGRRK